MRNTNDLLEKSCRTTESKPRLSSPDGLTAYFCRLAVFAVCPSSQSPLVVAPLSCCSHWPSLDSLLAGCTISRRL